MTCSLNSVNTASQVLTASSAVTFNGVDTFNLTKGTYLITFNADVVATGLTSLGLYSNNVNVNGAEASFTGTADTVTNISFTSFLSVSPSCIYVNNNKNVQIKTSNACTISNASITIIKLS